MKITLSQLNVMVGDILSNKSKNIDYIDEAADSGADPALPGEMVYVLTFIRENISDHNVQL